MSGKRIRKDNFIEDPRNQLFREFYRIVKGIEPEFFIMENVEGILNYKNGEVKDTIIELFSEIGYFINYKVLNTKDYGVPQARKRTFFVGCKFKKIEFPSKTHGDGNHLKKHTTIYDAISDLCYLNSGEGSEISNYILSPLTEYQIERRIGTNILYNHISNTHNSIILDRIKLIKLGQNREHLPDEYKTKSIHSGAYGRMEWDKCSMTLTTRFDNPTSGRFIHPELNRTITIREAARLQSFNDTYRFLGTLSYQRKQIGNAVSPILAKTLANMISREIE